MTSTRRALLAFALLSALSVAAAAAADSGAWLGVLMSRDATDEGVAVRMVIEDSPAAAMGLRARDRILSVDGTPVADARELLRALGDRRPGSWVELTYARRGEERQGRVRLDDRPEDLRSLKMRRAWVGLELLDLPPALRAHFGAPEDAGAMVQAIEPASPAEAAGFELGDVVFEVDGIPVGSAAEFGKLVAEGGVGNLCEFRVARVGLELTVESVLERDPEEPARR